MLRRCIKQMMRALMVSVVVLLVSLPGLAPQGVQPSAEQVKAVFLFNFAQFVQWPETAFASADAPLVIVVLGDDPFGDFLDETVLDETVRGHPLLVRRVQRVEDAKTSHIVYISPSEAERVPEILRVLRGRPILTVGDDAEFVRRGGMIGFAVLGNKVRMRINAAVAESAGLIVSSKLLHAADTAMPTSP